MNFLLHHEFALAELADDEERPAGAVGAMLPDLWRMADRRVRPRELDPPTIEAHPAALRMVLAGVEHHRAIDRWFHRSRVFTEGERALRGRFYATKSSKLLLFAHPAWEMCLDGALLRARGPSAVTADVAASLDRAEEALDAAVDLHHFGAAGATGDRPRFESRMARIVSAARDGSLHDDYLSAEGIARRLAGMRLAFGLGAPGARELDAWTDALGEAVDEADQALIRLRDERREARAPSDPRADMGPPADRER